MVVFPNAKINIGLNILARRSDGYHTLSSIMVPIGWQDILEITPSKSGATTLNTSGIYVDCPAESNLVMKAYNALNARRKLPPVDIYLRKNIPNGAGLGGGSADASFTLTTLNQMFNLEFSNDELAKIASDIGADCPFFIFNKPMHAEGIGTELTEIEIPQLKGTSIVVIKPDIHISTAEAYAGVTPYIPENKLDELIKLPISSWRNNIVNDFEKSLGYKFPEITKIKEKLYDQGAIYSSLSGSGSAVYGIFDNDKMAEMAKINLCNYTTFVCRL